MSKINYPTPLMNTSQSFRLFGPVCFPEAAFAAFTNVYD